MRKKIWAVFLCLTVLMTACAKISDSSKEQENERQEISSAENFTKIESLQTTDEKVDNSRNLYKDVLDLYYHALHEHQTYPEQWQPDKYYTGDIFLVPTIINPYWSWENTDNILGKEGFAFRDLNADGVDELIIGWIGNDLWNMDEGYVFAIYTIVNGKVTFAIEGWERCLYVIGEDGCLYESGISSAFEASYTKYKFSLEYEDFLEPLEKLYSSVNVDNQWWEHITNPEDIGVIEYAEKHEDLLIDEEEAFAIGEAWMQSGIIIDYTPFSDYIAG